MEEKKITGASGEKGKKLWWGRTPQDTGKKAKWGSGGEKRCFGL